MPSVVLRGAIVLCGVLILLCWTFSVGAGSIQARQSTSIPKGEVVKELECLGDGSQSYALYLPSNYTPDRKWPILYAFDPGARGNLPVERFQDAAEKYGWIVVGSNNSSNGPWDLAVNAWNAISKDTHQRFSIDDERVYATGFSGGARAAVRIASLCNCLAGVVATGAGFPVGLAPASSMHFLFFGAAGVDDFNFPEMRNLDEPLAKAGIVHRIEVFDGRHEWLPASVARTAMEWMELHAMKEGKRPRDESFISVMWQQSLKQAESFEQSKKYLEAYQTYSDLSDSFKGLRDVSEVEKKVSQLRDGRDLKAAIREEQEQISRQRDLEQQFYSLIARRERVSLQQGGTEETLDRSIPGSNPIRGGDEGLDPSDRLTALLGDLQKRSKAPEDSSGRRIARRTLEGLFIGFFEQGLSLLQTEKRYAEAALRFKVATEVNPDRSGAFFYLALAHAANGDKKRSLQALEKAVEKGFSDLGAINDNKAFDLIRNDPQYLKIVAPLVRR